MPFVLDGSITCAWCFEDELTPETDAILDALYDDKALVPAIWPTEVANTLLNGIKRKRLSGEDAYAFCSGLRRFSIEIQPPSSSLDSLLSSSTAHGLTVYDATYLDLALERRIPLATKDAAMRAAAAKVGVALLP